MIFDCDLTTDLPPWDFEVIHQGKAYRVKVPTSEQVCRIVDAGSVNQLAACRAMAAVFSELTGIDRDEVDDLDAEVICGFVKALGEMVRERLALKAAVRAGQLIMGKPQADSATRLN
jgi:hypothetical protein